MLITIQISFELSTFRIDSSVCMFKSINHHLKVTKNKLFGLSNFYNKSKQKKIWIITEAVLKSLDKTLIESENKIFT